MFGLALLIALFVHTNGNLTLKGIRGHGRTFCPYEKPAVSCDSNPLFSEESSCYNDNECSQSLKCCQQGCLWKCVEPRHYTKWCKVELDVGILFDSKTGKHSRKVQKMIYKVVRGMSLKEDYTHVSLGTIAPNASILTTFTSHANVKKVWKILKTVKPAMTRGNLSSALYMGKEMFSKENGGRKDAIKVLLVFTNGITRLDEDNSLLGMASSALREAGILVETIAVGEDINLFNLVQIATSDWYVWDKADQEFLQDVKKLEKKPCS